MNQKVTNENEYQGVYLFEEGTGQQLFILASSKQRLNDVDTWLNSLCVDIPLADLRQIPGLFVWNNGNCKELDPIDIRGLGKLQEIQEANQAERFNMSMSLIASENPNVNFTVVSFPVSSE